MATPIYPLDDAALTEQIRTFLYGDQRLTVNELQVLHTRTFQRLYDLRQLGWTDRVFPDAIHSRFNHSLGTLEQADRFLRWIISNCRASGKADLVEKAKKLEKDRWAVRLAALLHDIFHIPFGHTLEDELAVLLRHDEDEGRKILLLDRVVAEVVYWTYASECGNKPLNELDTAFWRAYESGDNLHDVVRNLYRDVESSATPCFQERGGVKQFVRDFAKAGEVLIYMGQYKAYEREGVQYVWSARAPLATVLSGTENTPLFDPASDYYICDIVGNTICADLLDYARRDIRCAGLKMDYDDRLLQHFTLVETAEEMALVRVRNGELAEEKVPVNRTRTAINLIKRRIRYDALTEILQVLKIRYCLTERVLFHRTKCAAGAMLGRAVGLLKPSDADRATMKRLPESNPLRNHRTQG